MSTFSTRLKKLRENKNITQQQMANLLKLSRSAISMYENGGREPNYETLELFADFFNVDIDYLIGRKDTTTDLAIEEACERYKSEGLMGIWDRFGIDIYNIVRIANDLKTENVKLLLDNAKYLYFKENSKEYEEASEEELKRLQETEQPFEEIVKSGEEFFNFYSRLEGMK